jgi:hypothetical protein
VSPLGRPQHGPPHGPQEAPRKELRHFPERVLAAGEPLCRIHRAGRAPWWFSSAGTGRFDLAPPRGTCYLAEDPLGAFVEVFRETRLVPEEEVRRRSISHLTLPRLLRLADCAARKARMFGLTAAIHSTPDFALTRAWAAAFAAAGFDGVRYLVSHDPAQRLAGYALFGDAGDAAEAASWPPGEPAAIGSDLLRAARRQFGLLVVPAP